MKRFFTISLLLCLSVFFGCTGSQSDSTATSKAKDEIELTEPERLAEVQRLCLPHRQTEVTLVGSWQGKELKLLQPKEGKLEVDGSTFRLTLKLTPGPNNVHLRTGGGAEWKGVVHRYTKKTEALLEKLRKGLKETITLPPLEYTFSETIQILPQGTLKLQGGTVFRFQPQAGLDVYGRLLAEGKKSAPISFEGTSKKGWRNIVFASPHQSRLVHCTLQGGRGSYYRLVLDGKLVEEDTLREAGHTVGGAITVLESPLYLEEVTFRHNSAWTGGGIYIFRSPQIVAKRVTFEENHAGHQGGGAFLMGTKGTFEETKGVNNRAQKGGALALARSQCTWRKGVFLKNRADRGGAVYTREDKSSFLECEFIENQGGYSGGAVFSHASKVLWRGCRFVGNSAIWGGGVAIWEGEDLVEESRFRGNLAESGGGGLFLRSTGAFLWKNLIEENRASTSGGGIFVVDGGGEIVENHIRKNWAKRWGGGLYLQNFSGSLVKNLIERNQAGRKGGGIAFRGEFLLEKNNDVEENTPSSVEKIEER